MRTELRRLQQQIGITAIYVTHDQSEALAMSDVIAVMDHGRIVQFGAPRDIYFRPENEFVASFIGAANLLSGKATAAVSPGATGPLQLDGGGEIVCTFPAGCSAGQGATASLRPESITIDSAAMQLDGANRLSGTISAASFLGSNVRYDVRVGDRILRVAAAAEQIIPPGQEVALAFASQAAVAVVRPSLSSG